MQTPIQYIIGILGLGISRPSNSLALALFALALGVYISGLPPSITWSHAAADSGELAAAVETFGVAHPPGYPTYILLGKVFSLIPVGDTAYRLNIMSALCGAGAVALTFLAARRLLRTISRATNSAQLASNADSEAATIPSSTTWIESIAAASGTLALTFAPIFWGQSTVTEVYALNALLAGTISYLLLSWLDDAAAAPRNLSLWRPGGAMFLFGLGMGNHFTLAALAIPLAVAVLWRLRSRAWSRWWLLLPAFLTGLGIYIYLPVSAAQNPPINWGDPADASGLWWEVSSKLYRGYVFGLPQHLWDNRLGDWAKQMVDQFQGVGIALALAGAWRMWRWDRVIAATLTVSFISLSAYATLYLAGDSFVFLIPVLMVTSWAIAVGVYYLIAETVLPMLGRAGWGRWAVHVGVGLTVLVLALGPLTSVLRNFDDQDLSSDYQARDYAASVFATVEPNAIVLADTDRPLFSLWYQQFVVEKDSGVTVVARGFFQFDWYINSFGRRNPGLLPPDTSGEFVDIYLAFIDSNLDKRPIYTTYEDPVLEQAHRLVPVGPVYRVERLT